MLPNWFELWYHRLRYPTLPLRGYHNYQRNGYINSLVLRAELYKHKCIQMCRCIWRRML